jgi:hypothetical protein
MILSAEAGVIHALLDENEYEAVRRLRDFLPGELAVFAECCREAARLAENVSLEKEAARRALLTPTERLKELLNRMGGA